MQSPQTFSRGNFSRSISATRKPAAAQKAAQTDPAGPAPTMATSTTSMALSVNCDRAAFNTSGARFKEERECVYGLVYSNSACFRHPAADSCHIFVVDWVCGFEFVVLCDFCASAVSLRGAARIRTCNCRQKLRH